MEDFRDKGLLALNKVLKNKQNIDIIEKNIYGITKINLTDKDDIERLYLYSIYQIINDISRGYKLKDILLIIKNNKLNWNHSFFQDIKNDEIDEDNFIIKPFEIEEGVMTCNCGSKRVFSYQKQSRGADETASTYAECMLCKKKWVYSG
jgi:DNA-directed RNA polymerase subunit M/transcription elongation factor TFIIS